MASSAADKLLRLFIFFTVFTLTFTKEVLITAQDELDAMLDSTTDMGDLVDLVERQVSSASNGGSTWWFANIKRQGTIAYGNSSYVLFRNVKDFGAVGDGMTNDTAAMNAALALGPRCVGQYDATAPCESSTIRPAIVYIPPGTYIITGPLIMYYNTIIIGDALNMPTIKAHPQFYGAALLDSDVYYSGGASWYANQNNFYRQVRNLNLDVTAQPYGTGICVHWQVAQATSLQNLVMNMRVGGGTSNKQQGIFMDNGSGGFMRDLVFNGGAIGFFVGNQQFTASNLTFNNCMTAIRMNWDWLWAWRYVTINNCPIGFDISQPPVSALGQVLISDSSFHNVSQAIVSNYNCSITPVSSQSMMLHNVDFRGATTAVSYPNGTIILPGGTIVADWLQGETYSAYYGSKVFPTHGNETCYVPMANQVCIQSTVQSPPIPAGLKNPSGGIVDRAKPAYDNYPLSAFVSAKSNGCAGDGITDDTVALQRIINNVSPGQVVYLDHGAYIISNTIFVPAGVKMVGEGWALIMVLGASPTFSDMNNPEPAFRVGKPGDVGSVEMQDIIFETRGAAPGAIIVEWNLAEDAQASAGMWDVHWRIGGTMGTLLQSDHCAKSPAIQIVDPDPTCIGSFLLLHITSTASLYMENNWGWVADHELDLADHNQINVFNGRGLLIESTKPVWVIGGSFEHSMLYNYQTAHAQNVYMTHIQSETAYMQTNPRAMTPFPPQSQWSDPTFSACYQDSCFKTWGLRIYNSSYIFVYGSGLYSFFQNYDSTCLFTETCQENAASLEESEAIYIFGLYTVGMNDLVQVDGTDLVPNGQNKNTFGQSVIVFEYP